MEKKSRSQPDDKSPRFTSERWEKEGRNIPKIASSIHVGIATLEFIALSAQTEETRNRAGRELADVLKKVLGEWNWLKGANPALHPMIKQMEENAGFVKRRSELFPKPGTKDALGDAVRAFTFRFFWKQIHEEYNTLLQKLGASSEQYCHGTQKQVHFLGGESSRRFLKWAKKNQLSERIHREEIPVPAVRHELTGDREFTMILISNNADRVLHEARSLMFDSYWKDVFAPAARTEATVDSDLKKFKWRCLWKRVKKALADRIHPMNRTEYRGENVVSAPFDRKVKGRT